jgi:ABC-type lipoprotein export system ATPase subunit
MSEKALARLRQDAVGFVFQAFHLMDELTAVENVELPALLAGWPSSRGWRPSRPASAPAARRRRSCRPRRPDAGGGAGIGLAA